MFLSLFGIPCMTWRAVHLVCTIAWVTIEGIIRVGPKCKSVLPNVNRELALLCVNSFDWGGHAYQCVACMPTYYDVLPA